MLHGAIDAIPRWHHHLDKPRSERVAQDIPAPAEFVARSGERVITAEFELALARMGMVAMRVAVLQNADPVMILEGTGQALMQRVRDHRKRDRYLVPPR